MKSIFLGSVVLLMSLSVSAAKPSGSSGQVGEFDQPCCEQCAKNQGRNDCVGGRTVNPKLTGDLPGGGGSRIKSFSRKTSRQ